MRAGPFNNGVSVLKVGDKVRLNDEGLEQCFGRTFALGAMKEKVYTITDVDPKSMTKPEPSFLVEVDDQDLNQLILSDYCFDKVS